MRVHARGIYFPHTSPRFLKNFFALKLSYLAVPCDDLISANEAKKLNLANNVKENQVLSLTITCFQKDFLKASLVSLFVLY